jgi:transcriptional regulator with XRE-family HTH domain
MTSPTREEVAIAFGQVLTEHLLRTRRKRVAVAQVAKIARSHLYKLSRGREQPSLTVFIGLSDALGVNDIQLFADLLRRLGRPLPPWMEVLGK